MWSTGIKAIQSDCIQWCGAAILYILAHEIMKWIIFKTASDELRSDKHSVLNS